MLFKIEFYVPESHCEQVKLAMFEAGAGRVGEYDRCSWQVLGSGQYRPLEGSSPFVGEVGQVETASEFKVEMVCPRDELEAVILAMVAAHPYEEVAYFVTAFAGGEAIAREE